MVVSGRLTDIPTFSNSNCTPVVKSDLTCMDTEYDVDVVVATAAVAPLFADTVLPLCVLDTQPSPRFPEKAPLWQLGISPLLLCISTNKSGLEAMLAFNMSVLLLFAYGLSLITYLCTTACFITPSLYSLFYAHLSVMKHSTLSMIWQFPDILMCLARWLLHVTGTTGHT
eukprot:scpid71820/ scgid25763/ 